MLHLSKGVPRSVFLIVVASSLWAEPFELFRATFDKPIREAWLSVQGGAQQIGGVLRSKSLAHWRRGGLEVGPIPMPQSPLSIQYDFRPVRFGRQCQEFVSQAPRTHWYMMYANPQGRLRLHTLHRGRWHLRGQAQKKLRLGLWYRAHVTLTRTSIRLVVAERRSKQLVWDTGTTPMDDIGESTTFILTDEALTVNDGATEWDNFVVATQDAAFAKRFTAATKRLAEDTQRRERERADAEAAARELRRRSIALIPMPRKIRFQKGRYEFAQAAIAYPAGLNSEAESVRAILSESLGRALSLHEDGKEGIVLCRVDEGPWPPAKTRLTEGYRLVVTPRGIRIQAQTRAGFLCAAQTLGQLARSARTIPAMEITDWPAIENRLVMIAVSQGGFQVIDLDYWKRIIRELANVKINIIMPYFEGGTYYYEKYPFLGVKGRDGFTGDKARLLSEYGYAHGVEVVPQQESLGHAGNILCHKELAGLRESGGVFCSSKPEVFSFLGDLFDELVAAFPRTRYLHVGGDEFTHGLAKCPLCKARAEKIGKEGLYAEHMMRLRKMLAARNRTMMIWRHERGFTESAANKLAKDIVVFDWHYGNQRSYPTLQRLQKLGFENVWATPAVTRYYGPTNDFARTFGNIRGFLSEAVERGVPGECTCTWVHGIWGGRNLFELNYYALVYSAQCAWTPTSAEEDDFRWRFARHWFGLKDGPLAEEVLHAWHAPFGESKDHGFWHNSRDAEPRLAAPPAATIADIKKSPKLPLEAERLMKFCRRAHTILERWKVVAARNQVTIDFLLHDVHIYETLVRRIRVLNELRCRYPQMRTTSPDERAAALRPIVENLKALVNDYRQIEHMFQRSIREAGGARCGRGSFSRGEIRFRAQQGRRGIENLLKRLSELEGKAPPPTLAELTK